MKTDTLLALLLLATGAAVLAASPTLAAGLGALCWVFVAYMLARAARIVLTLPAAPQAQPPDPSALAHAADQDHPQANPPAPWTAASLLHSARVRSRTTGDQTALLAFVSAQFATHRQAVYERSAPTLTDLNTLALEGVMGTVLGLMAFLAQSAALFALPELSGLPTEALVDHISATLASIDLMTAVAAFLTSLIGWTARAWLGQLVERRRIAELSDLTALELWMQTHWLAHGTPRSS